MAPAPLTRQLDTVDHQVSWWRAQFKLLTCAAAVILGVWAFGLLDLWLRYGRAGRLAAWLAIVAGTAAAAWWVMRTLAQRHSPQAVAAMIEHAFPQLDNRLINYLQFATDPGDDPFKRAYLSTGPPPLQRLDFHVMKNRRMHRRASMALVAAVLLMAAPALFFGQAWGVAVWRVVNPFANVAPVTLTRIVSVDPGDTTVRQGDPLVLTCTLRGHPGHRVVLDLDPADKERTTYALGRVDGGGTEEFSYRLPEVNTGVRYRFRAGDATAVWYTVTTRPPLAFRELQATVTPPAYTRRPSAVFDALADDLVAPLGSEVTLRLRANLPVETLTLLRGSNELAMASVDDPTAWTGKVTLSDAVPPRVLAVGRAGDTVEQAMRVTFELDRLPAIQVLAPEGRPVLPPGAQPTISFSVSDDYGLAEVTVEQVAAGGTRKASGEVLQSWTPGGAREWTQTWTDTRRPGREDTVLAYRITARDNCPLGDKERVTRSAAIIFNAPSADDAARTRNTLEDQAFAALSRVIELQRENIAKTELYEQILDSSTANQWQETAERQQQIRSLTRTLLDNPLNPLGNLTGTAKKLYLNEMAEVIPLLAGVPRTAAAERGARVTRALNMEHKILRQLTFADVAAAKSKVQRRVAALNAMLTRMIKEQGEIIKQTRGYVEQAATVGETLVGRQDELSMDLTAFIAACRRESGQVVGNDEAYAELLLRLADACDEQKVRGDMLLAAEDLDANRPGDALPHEDDALRKLKALLAMMDEIAMEEELEQEQAMLEQIEEARKRFKKIEDLHRKALETMDVVKEQKDKSDKDFDTLEEEYEELLKNTKEALLQVPTDLNIFMELNVANDIVEDVFSVFEEIEQAEGSEEKGAGDVNERALAKREGYLDGMEEAMGRLDDLEGWLAESPDSTKITAEAFDQEEMPEAGIALGALTTEAEELIGDLLDKQEDMAEAADDGAINTSVPDMVANNVVKEGDVASFAAKGKSGNETPDHKEQDGRSNVGRQGQATGETAAGSGTVNEGDKNIEERRTQDPTQSGQVDLDGDENIDTKATGGGKLATGKADDVGMDGGVKRMDSQEAGSAEGLAALMAEKADTLFAKASMQNVRADALKDAAHHLRQSSDAIARGDIGQLKEHRRNALASLKQAKAQIDAAATGSFSIQPNTSLLDDVVDGGPELAPPTYRELVAEYYKALNDQL